MAAAAATSMSVGVNRQCPPGVRRPGRMPAAAHRCTVRVVTPRRAATCPARIGSAPAGEDPVCLDPVAPGLAAGGFLRVTVGSWWCQQAIVPTM